MATKLYTKTTQFTQPAWTQGWEFIDGIYVDNRFFGENIPILGATLLITVTPTKHLRTRSLAFTARTFKNGQVGSIFYSHQWLPLQDHQWRQQIEFNSDFYGPGLNPFYWVCSVDLPTNAEVIYTVNYELEVVY